MRCGRLSVEGEAEEVISKKKKKPHHGKKMSSSNPYSTIGLDKFASLNAELSAKREYVARKTGTPEAMVRFVYTSKGWAPVVVKNGHGGKDEEVLLLPPNSRGKDSVRADEGCDNGDIASSSSQMTVAGNLPWWSEYLATTAFGVLTVSAIMVRKFAVPAVAMAVVMVVGSLQRRWMGGVMCTRSFIDTAVSYFSELFIHWNRSLQVRKTGPPKERLQVEAEQHVASPEHNIITERSQGGPLFSFSAPSSPTVRDPTMFFAPKSSSRSQDFSTQLEARKKKIENRQLGRVVSMDGQSRNQDFNTQLEAKKKKTENRQLRRAVSMDGQPRKPIKSQQSESSFWAREGEIDATLGATLMLILLFFLVFYGRLYAICFTSAYLYVLSKLRIELSIRRGLSIQRSDN
ncbi:hypothetical protein SUGI_0575240 [Cryptomeria japonica]|nr:hypothetical protein SUGI_0575240 [Cryptomeria japonica]